MTKSTLIILIIILLTACQSNPNMTQPKDLEPPKADKVSYQHKMHGDIRIDNYYWLRERDNPEVIDYLERENDYYQKMTAHAEAEKSRFLKK